MKKEKKTKASESEQAEQNTSSTIEQVEAFFSKSDGYYGCVYEHSENGFDQEIKISTGSYQLDMYLDGGFNAGSITMMFGDEESGKTAQALTWAKNWQDHFGDKAYVIVYDAEGRMTLKKILMSGIDQGRLLVVKSNSAESILQNIHNLIDSNPEGKRYFFVVDSINGLTTSDERSKTLDQAEARAGVARVNSMAFKKFSLPMHVKGHHLYLCSQTRAGNVSGFGGSGSKPGGGKAPAFYGDLIAKMGLAWDANSPRYIKDGEKVIGRYTELDFKKSYNEVTGTKLAIPIKYNHTGGVWRANEVVDLALAWGVLQKNGCWFSIQNEVFIGVAKNAGIEEDVLATKTQGHFNCVNFFEENEDLRKVVIEYIKSMIA